MHTFFGKQALQASLWGFCKLKVFKCKCACLIQFSYSKKDQVSRKHFRHNGKRMHSYEFSLLAISVLRKARGPLITQTSICDCLVSRSPGSSACFSQQETLKCSRKVKASDGTFVLISVDQ